jgi:hypothetical protein
LYQKSGGISTASFFQNPPSKKNEKLLHASRLRVAGIRGRTLKNCGKKTTIKFFTSQLATRNSQPSPPGSKKLAVDLGFFPQPQSYFIVNFLTLTVDIFEIL